MPAFSAHQKIQLIKRVERGERVASICREAGISRKTFYQWLKKTKDARSQLKPLLLTDGRVKQSPPPKPLNPLERFTIINSAINKKGSVAGLCREAGISRKTFYKWRARLNQSDQFPLVALEDQRPRGENHPRYLGSEKEELILDYIVRNPVHSCRQIANALPEISYHGIQNVLERNSLNTYNRRLVYQQSRQPVAKPTFVPIPASPRTFDSAKILRFLIAPFVTVPKFALSSPYFRTFIATFLLSFLSFIAIFQSSNFLAQTTPAQRIGLIFASISLAFGFFFFLYSLKYYFTLMIILGFSRQVSPSGENGNGNGMNGNGKPWWKKIFGGNGPSFAPQSGAMEGEGNGYAGLPAVALAKAGGLQPNLDHIELTRRPFVSIHLALYNEKRVVDRLLTAATSMEYENYEVIVVDDSTDGTTEIVEEFAERWNGKSSLGGLTSSGSSTEVRPLVKVIHRETREGFKGGALQVALQNTDPRAEFILVFDADFIPYPDTITQFLKYFQSVAGTLDFQNTQKTQKVGMSENQIVRNSGFSGSPSFPSIPNPIAAIQGYQWPSSAEATAGKHVLGGSNIAAIQGYQWHVLNKSENWITGGVRSEYAGSYVVERSGAEILGALKQIAGSVYMIRRDVLSKYGWGTSITEDFELTLKLYRDGWKVVCTPYVQAPSECVSTIKRLIRQRMRWAEGHSHNVRKMFWQLMWGRWEEGTTVEDRRWNVGLEDRGLKLDQSRRFIPSRLTLAEKLEFLYLSPYYLQAAFFILGTFSWFLAEAVFKVRLPFWTSLWGWSLVLTNLFSLPLLNTVGLFLEEAEERDYLGILSFVVLTYLLAPFQAYAAVKGFLEKEEGPWFRTPKTGRITDIFTPGRFYRFIFGVFGRAPAPAVAHANNIRMGLVQMNPNISINSQYLNSPVLALNTANNQFNSFQLSRRDSKLFRRGLLFFLLILVAGLFYSSVSIPFLSRPWERLQALDTKGKNSEISLSKVSKEAKPIPTEKSESQAREVQETGPALRKDFQARENPELIFSFPQGKGEKKEKSVSSALWPQAQASSEDQFLAQLFSSSGKEIQTPLEVFKGDKGDFKVKVPVLANFVPGVYKLKVELDREGETFNQEQDFSWGVLALNTNKTLYTPGEAVFFQMAVLDDFGHTLCDAQLELEVIAPDEQIAFFSTQNKTIQKSAECGPKTVTNTPDYLATYEIPKTTGVYKVKLWAQTANGVRAIEDSFRVEEKIAFDIEREGPTRIYPQAFYKMRIKIKANQDFRGKVWEFLPEPFEVIRDTSKAQITTLESDVWRLIKEKTGKAPIVEAPWDFAKAQSKQKALSWEVVWKTGGLYELNYQFKAPMISPQFYLLGPLRLAPPASGQATQDNKLVLTSFEEARKWQIASDAEVTIDNAVSTTPNANQRTPNVVFISDTTGYAFYADFDGTCGYSKTTDGGANWGAYVAITTQTDCLGTTVWYDRWTPGDTTGTYIHIVFSESGGSDLYYERIDTASSDAQLGEVNATGANQGGSLLVSNSTSITKGTDGDLYMGTSDSSDSFVIKCTTTCGTAANWTEAGTNPMDLVEDEVILRPLASGNILLINWDISVSTNSIRSKVYTDSTNAWDSSWVSIGNAVGSISFKHAFDATVNKDTNSLYLCWNNATNATTGDIQTALYNGSWEVRDNVTTDVQAYQCSIALDENNGDVYVAYVDYANTGLADIFYKKSSLGMRSWGSATQVNTTQDNHQSVSLNLMSDQRIFAIWYETDLDDLWGNTVADLTPPSPFEAHYRWRNDDGSETAATWKAALDTSVSSQNKSENVRARFAVPRLYGLSANYNFRLQVAAKTESTCEAQSTGFSDVPVAGSCGAAVACMADSIPITDQEATTNQVFTPWKITSNATANAEVADALAVDSDYIYLAGYENDPQPDVWITRDDDVSWRIEKRRLSDGALCTAANCGTQFGTNGVITVNPSSYLDKASGIAVDADYIYVKGYYCADAAGCAAFPYNYAWRIEKRNKTDGALVTAFGSPNGYVTSNPSAYNDTTENNGIAVDDNYLYAVGNCNYDATNCPRSLDALAARIEKRNKTTGALCDSVSDCSAGAFGTGDAGWFMDDTSNGDDIFENLILDSTNGYIYISGQCGITTNTSGNCGSTSDRNGMMLKIGLASGDLDTSFDTDGRVISDPSVEDVFGVLGHDSSYVYVGGMCDSCGTNGGAAAYYEKISKSDGSYDTAFDGDGRLVVDVSDGGDDGAESGTNVSGSSLYIVVGCTGCGPNGDTAQVVQKRNTSDSTLDTTFGNGGSIIIDPSTRPDGSLDSQISGDYFYLGSYDSAQGAWPNTQFHVEKIDLQSGFNGSFAAGKMIEDTSNQNSAAISLQKEQFTEMEYNFQFTSNAVDNTTYCMRVVNATTALDSYPKVATTVVVPERLWLILPALPFLAKIIKRWKRGRSKR